MQTVRRPTETVQGEYSYLPIERVHFGAGSTGKLSMELDRLGSKNPFIITGRTISDKTNLVARIEKDAGRKVSGVFNGILQHAPLGPLRKAVEEARRSKADALISLGGGSPIDSAKIIVKELSHDYTGTIIPHIAIPTTLSAAEFSHSAGMTDEAEKKKLGVRDSRMVPRIIILDPEVTVPTPAWLWSSTGIRSLDHAVESILASKHQPYTDTLALEAIRLFFENLLISTENPENMKVRLECQFGAWMSYAGAISVGTGLSHAIGRVIGARYDIPHGITSCITLAEVIRMAARKSISQLIPIGKAAGVRTDARNLSLEQIGIEVADRLTGLLKQLSLAKRLRDYNVPRSDLPKLAEEVASTGTGSREDALSILEKVY